ncbi:MAG: hypothetical protein IPP81_16365 [Chitinophagaceae bacterium]|nr:hypothetical protein [Chitinophagaceae bacterium]
MKSLLCTFMVALFLTVGTASAQTDKTPAPAPMLDSVAVKDYIGKYDAGIGTITITWENSKLNCELEGKGSAEIIATTTPDVLTIVGYGGTISFLRDEQKKVNKVLIEVQGQTFEGVRF